VICGGAAADAPEPVADFFDLFCAGDGEETLPAVIEVVRQGKRAGASRAEMILQAARTVPGVYAPGFYQPEYGADGAMTALTPLRPDVPARISRPHLSDLSNSPGLLRPLVPLSEAVHDRVTIEIMRGCPNACRFCQAGATKKPVRWRSVAEILDIARQAIAATGYREISLLSLSTSDYPHFAELIDRLNAEFTPRHISISLPSLRVYTQLAAIPKLTSEVRKHGMTIAAEAGSERLRQAIRKDITEASMLEGVTAAWRAGWRSVKVYFLAGLPGETPADIDAIFDLCLRLADTRRQVDGQRGSINAAVSWMVPRPHTPMQWSAMQTPDYFWSVRDRLKDLARRTPVQFRFHHIERSILEALIARGDRRLGQVIELAWRNGARFDGWDEYFDQAKWEAAFISAGVSVDFYTHRELTPGAVTPWSHIGGERESLLLAECERMQAVLAGPG
jgi:radical SAM superfamily enzyme YgiQ (UPF0313 family)